MLRLDGQEGSDEMIQVFKEAQPQLQELSRNLKLRIKGLSTFGQRVLYAKAITEPDEAFWQFVRYVCLLLKVRLSQNRFMKSSIFQKITPKI